MNRRSQKNSDRTKNSGHADNKNRPSAHENSGQNVIGVAATTPSFWLSRLLKNLLPRFLRIDDQATNDECGQNIHTDKIASSRSSGANHRQKSGDSRTEAQPSKGITPRRNQSKNAIGTRHIEAQTPLTVDCPMIADTDELQQAVQCFAPEPRIALDTEADSLHCYFDKLCLIQLSVPGRNLLVDPLSGISLTPLFDALKGKTVVIHSADYDLRLLRRSGYEGPCTLFDTMIAARLCGSMEFGLASLLHQHFGVTLAKASQKANWALRPLSQTMLEYAINDTLNLLKLAEIQETRLRELGRWEWFQQMCDRAVRSSSVQRERDPDSLWRISGYADLSPRGTAILRALWHWRDQEAQAVDKPAFHILNNDLLLTFSAAFDSSQTVDPRHLRGERRARFFGAANTALQLPETEWPKMIRKPRLRTTQEQEMRFRALKKIRDSVATDLQLDPTLIAPKATLEQLSRNETEALESLMPWQRTCLNLG
jgi:ribonuclease D